MNTYKVHVSEVLSRIIEVDAETEEQAQELVEEQYNAGDLVLGADDYNGMGAEFLTVRKCTSEDDDCNDNLGCEFH